MTVAAQPHTQSAENEASRKRPVATFKQSGVEVTIWKNTAPMGDVKNTAPMGDIYNTTIRNSYKDEKTDVWKETTSFSPTDLAVVVQLAGQAFQEIVRLKQQSRVKPTEASAPARHATRHRNTRARATSHSPA